MRIVARRELLALVLFLSAQCFCSVGPSVFYDDVTVPSVATCEAAQAPGSTSSDITSADQMVERPSGESSSDSGDINALCYDVSIAEVKGSPKEARIRWLVPPADPLSSGIAVVDLGLLRSLGASGAGVRVLAPYDETKYYFLIGASPQLSERALSDLGDVLWRSGQSYLVSVDERSRDGLSLLRAQGRLLVPSEASPASTAPFPSTSAPSSTGSEKESFWIGRMVSSVSEDNLLRHVCSLSGKIPVNLSTGQHIIKTRYSYHPDCLKAAEYLYSQFDSMGVDVAYDSYLGTPLKCVEFVGLEGYAVGERGTIYHTSDGGSSWEKQTSGVGNNLWKTCFISQDTGWAAGTRVLLKTTDRGSHWEPVDVGIRNPLFGVEFCNATIGWVCGEGGIIRKTTDGGVSWTTQTNATVSRLCDVEFTDSLNGWAVGYVSIDLVQSLGAILHTSNGGKSWESQTSGVDVRLYDVCFVDSLNGWAVGGAATILRTTDGGISWQIQESGRGNDLFAVCFTSKLCGEAVGARGTVLSTTDGGAQWIVRQSGVYTNLYGVSFADSSRGWAVGTNEIICTVDGGTDWFSLNDNLPGTWKNVVATLEGSGSSSEVYVVCGHYDSMSNVPMSRAPGADDNASGVSLILEAARILKDYGFESTIRFVCFSGEEYLGYGSSHYAGKARAHNEDIRAALNFDMIAYGQRGIYLYGSTASRGVVDYSRAIGNAFVPDLPVVGVIDNSAGFSDHDAFWDRGYAAVCGIELDYDSNPYWHTTGDGLERLDMGMATDVTRFAIASVASLARLVETPVVAATVDIEPNTLNLKSNGQYITCYVELPSELPLTDVVIPTVMLNDSVTAEPEPVSVGDYDCDRVPDLMVKFPRDQVSEILPAGDSIEIIVSGEAGGFVFQGKDTIRVIVGKEYGVHAADTILVATELPRNSELFQNYPDPFNPRTFIPYQLSVASAVSLQIFDVKGRPVRTLLDEEKPPGQYLAVWDGKSDTGVPVPSGVYFCKIKTRDFTRTRKMLLLR